MNRYRFLIVCAAAVVGLAGTAPAQSQRVCSDLALSGAWGYTETGSVIATTPTGATTVTPIAAVGRYEFDRAGKYEGVQYATSGGPVGNDTKQGTYEINPDCTGTLTHTAYRDGVPQRRSVWWFVIVDRGQELRGIMKSLMTPDGTPLPVSPVITMTARKMLSGPLWFSKAEE